MKTLAGRGPLGIVLEPGTYLPELRGFEVSMHDKGGWTATRRAGMMIESVRLDMPLGQAGSSAADPDATVEWKVTVSCLPDRTSFSGPTAAGTALLSAAFAFWVTYESLEWLPRKPSLHFSLATVMLVVTFGATIAVLYRVVAVVSNVLVARMERRPPAAMRARADRLAAFAASIPLLGLASDEAASS